MRVPGMIDEREADAGQSGDAHDLTSFHVGRAGQGDAASLEWIVKRFSPLLLAQARFRLGERLRRIHEPEDLVNEVWAIALPRIAELGWRDGRRTPVLLKFLATTLLNRVNDWVRVEITGPRGRLQAAGPAGNDSDASVARLPADSEGVVTSIVRRERDGEIARLIDELDPDDREIIVLRAIEQNPGSMVAFILDLTEKAVSMRYRRALDRLKARLPSSVFEELPAD
jgi:RNA polymerase sigma-70 factor, ECF subfamily